MIQPDATTCGPSCLVVARTLRDPGYGAWLEAGGRERFADEVFRAHRRANRVWPRSLGTTPWAVARELGQVTGRSYGVVAARRDREAAYDATLRACRAGELVAVYVGSRWLPRHVVLATGAEDDELTCYDPARGSTTTIHRQQWCRDALRDLGGWPQVWAVVLPRG